MTLINENIAANSQMMGLADLGKDTSIITVPGQSIPAPNGTTVSYSIDITLPNNKIFTNTDVNFAGVTFNNIQDFYYGVGYINDLQLADNTNGVIWKCHKTISGNILTVTASAVNNKVAAIATIPTVTVTVLSRSFAYPWS